MASTFEPLRTTTYYSTVAVPRCRGEERHATRRGTQRPMTTSKMTTQLPRPRVLYRHTNTGTREYSAFCRAGRG